MKIYEMKLAGVIGVEGIPDYFATIHRTPGNVYITVTISGKDGDREHLVQADSREDIYSMAECLQHHLDGCRGTNSMVHNYYRLLHMFAD